jgi:crotonobetainyl-CoA:carnitine CoA-transferase CaiB-like acyl-CoA transferase
MDASLLTLLNQGTAALLGGAEPVRRGNRHPSIAPYETFATADRPIAVAAGNDRLFARLCEVVGLPADDPRFATNADRVAHRDELGALLEARFAAHGADEWIAALRAAAVPAGPINDVAAAWELARSLGLEPTEPDGLPRPPLRLDGDRPPVRLAPPALDEHGDAIRAWLRERR